MKITKILGKDDLWINMIVFLDCKVVDMSVNSI